MEIKADTLRQAINQTGDDLLKLSTGEDFDMKEFFIATDRRKVLQEIASRFEGLMKT